MVEIGVSILVYWKRKGYSVPVYVGKYDFLSDFKRFDFQDIVLSVRRLFRHLNCVVVIADY